jgi:hypothetical protein
MAESGEPIDTKSWAVRRSINGLLMRNYEDRASCRRVSRRFSILVMHVDRKSIGNVVSVVHSRALSRTAVVHGSHLILLICTQERTEGGFRAVPAVYLRRLTGFETN